MKFKNDIELQAGLEDLSGSTGTSGQILSSTVTGTTWIDPSTIVAEAATVVVIACKNTSGATITKGTPVYQTGTVGATATIEIALADALISTGDLPAIGLLQTALNNNGFGFVVISGALTNFTTSPIDGVVPVTCVNDMQGAVNKAHAISIPGDVVLLSPACASFDTYAGFEARGDDFVEAVNALKKGEAS